MDKEKIKKALDHFENDEFTDAKNIISSEIRKKRNDWMKDKLDLKESLNEKEEEDEDDEEEDKDDEEEDEDEE